MSLEHEPQSIQPSTRAISRSVLPEAARKETTSTMRRERVKALETTAHLPVLRVPQHLALEIPSAVLIWVDSTPRGGGEGRTLREDRRLEFPRDSLIEEGMIAQSATTGEALTSIRGDGVSLYALRVDRTSAGALRARWTTAGDLRDSLSDDPVGAAEHFLIAEVWSTWELDGEVATTIPVFIDLLTLPVLFNPAASDDITRPVRAAAQQALTPGVRDHRMVWVQLEEASRLGEISIPTTPDLPIPAFGPWTRLPGGALRALIPYSVDGELTDPVKASTSVAEARLADYRSTKQLLTRLRDELLWVDNHQRKDRLLGLVDQLGRLADDQAARYGISLFHH